ncbi:hypothetical protein [cf. Phormidesmis sp. LEGE 11477]|uniref:hypothetical protein n=1 Tax=cf. Phormidesmis sp. LEGE 11477 TaxID=1828680 RepID=UPI00187E20FF|nr:hypothetical protein [cf. Phormidesmis sp. LEGE 11477]MBE9064574.1 hypothetical protein [cf. Phormidesmis sp. LEGE 11477]
MPIRKPTIKDLLIGTLISTSLTSCFAPSSGIKTESGRQEAVVPIEAVEAIREQLEAPGTNPTGGVEASYIQDALTNPFTDIEGPGLIYCATLFEYGEPYPVTCFGDSIDGVKNSLAPPLKTSLGVWVYAGKVGEEFRYHPVGSAAELWGAELKESEYYGSWILETYPKGDRFDIATIEAKGRELILSEYKTPE